MALALRLTSVSDLHKIQHNSSKILHNSSIISQSYRSFLSLTFYQKHRSATSSWKLPVEPLQPGPVPSPPARGHTKRPGAGHASETLLDAVEGVPPKTCARGLREKGRTGRGDRNACKGMLKFPRSLVAKRMLFKD